MDGPMPPVVMHCQALIDQRNAASLPAIRPLSLVGPHRARAFLMACSAYQRRAPEVRGTAQRAREISRELKLS
jgi:hypothetical protein